MHQFGVWHEGGHHTIQGLPILKHLLRTLHGDVMVRYVCRADTPCTLFLTINRNSKRVLRRWIGNG
ncbi:hypothetical protein ACET69_04505 [Aeromonas veronii]